MGNFFKSFFSSQPKEESSEEKEKNNVKNFDILKYDGVRAQRAHKLPYAIRCFKEALNIQEDFETRSFLTAAYMASNELDLALEELNRMHELKPEDVNTLLTRIHVLFLLDKDVEVIPDCETIITLDAENPTAYYMMAKAKRTTGDMLGAIADLTKSVALKEDFESAYLLRAEILLQMRQADEALQDAEKVIQLNPEEELAYLTRGKIHAFKSQFDEAHKDFEKVLSLNPFNEDAALLAGQLLIAENKLDEAIAFFDEIIENSPTIGRAYAERGRAKNLKGDKQGAFEDLKKSIELNPEGEEAQKIEGTHSNFENMYKGGVF